MWRAAAEADKHTPLYLKKGLFTKLRGRKALADWLHVTLLAQPVSLAQPCMCAEACWRNKHPYGYANR